MSEDAKKSIAGALTARPNSDDRKPFPLPAPAPTAVPPKKVIIKSADMIPDMQKEAVDIAVAAFERYNVEKDVAEQIKKEFDKRHGPTWHCIVGRNFGSYVTHETNHFVYFYLDLKAVLLFKSG
ncbi:Dynein light chain 2 [Spatholobus suberectus]|nr:Dynein light chain 2 [Spatholobus suberectus]